MKIGFVLDDGLDKPDGVQQYILTLGKQYELLGHEVIYLVGATARSDLKSVYAVPRNLKVRFNGNALSVPLPASAKKIKKILENEKFDVLHVQVPYSPFFGARVIRLAATDTVIFGTFHILPYGWMSRIGTKLLGIYLAKNLKRFDEMVSVSKPAAIFAKSSFGVDSVVVPNSVRIEEFASRRALKNDKKIRILFLGRLVKRKGAHKLLEAVKILSERGQVPPGLQVNICGDGPMREDLEAYAEQNGLSRLVKFHGFISSSDKIKFMQRADISIFPSLSGESFGIVLIEAMAANGGVVVGGDNPGYRSVLNEIPETLVNANSPSAIADKLHELISDPGKRESLKNIQNEHVRQYNTQKVAATLLDMYQACKSRRNN